MLPIDIPLIHWRWWEYSLTQRKASAYKYFAESRSKMPDYPLVLGILGLSEYITDGEYEMTFCCLHCSEIAQFTIVCYTEPSQYMKFSMYEILCCCFSDCGNRIDRLHTMSLNARISIFLFQQQFLWLWWLLFKRRLWLNVLSFGMKMPIRLRSHETLLRNKVRE